MAVTIMCPNLRCRKILMVPGEMRGSRVRCSYCGMLMLVPKAKAMHMMTAAERKQSGDEEESGKKEKKEKK